MEKFETSHPGCEKLIVAASYYLNKPVIKMDHGYVTRDELESFNPIGDAFLALELARISRAHIDFHRKEISIIEGRFYCCQSFKDDNESRWEIALLECIKTILIFKGVL